MNLKKDSLAMTVGEKLSLPPETLGEVPVVQIHGRRHISVENHHGILEYTNELVRIGVKRGCIFVRGSGLAIARMTRSCVEICGSIYAVELE